MSSSFRPPVAPTGRRTIDSPVGPLTLMGTDTVLTHLLFANQIEGAGQVEPVHDHGDDPVADPRGFAAVVAQLTEYFAGERTIFDVELAPSGTPFQLEVWRALTSIPYGETCSYGELASRVGRPGAARAVGAANGQNPISILVPCHRVIGASGDLTGYGGGLDRKSLLLGLEHDRTEPRLPLAVG